MKLSDHTNHIRQTVQSAVENRLGRLGIAINAVEVSLTAEQQKEKERLLEVFQSLKDETGTNEKAYEKLVDELTFTLFNRIAAIKVSEAHTLIPETITQRPENGNRSFAHSAFLEQFPEKRNEDQEGLVDFIQYEFQNLSENLPLYSLSHYYHLLPTAIELKEIIDAFNAVEADEKDIDPDIWKSDDVLGWLYESYNNYKKVAHKDSKAKTEYDKVSIQSQVYTPKWVVKFLVDNSLGKQYLEMYPHSDIKNKYAIANAPTERVRDIKTLHDIKLIDPAMGSGNFLLYAFDVFYDLYQDQIDNYGADYEERDIPKLILEHNLHGVDLDNRAAQIAQLGLYIKARRKRRNVKINHFNLVSSDFVLPAYEEVKHIFFPSDEKKTSAEQAVERVIISIWDDLQQAHKFGALIRIEEIVEQHLSTFERSEVTLFTSAENETYLSFRQSFINDLYQAVSNYASTGAHNFMQVQASSAVTYLDVLTNKYDVAVANPPYTDSADFGPELKEFVEKYYKKPYKFHTNLYATFIKRCYELTTEDGNLAMVHPPTFMYIKTFEDVRQYILDKTSIDFFVELGLGGIFHNADVQVDACMYILSKLKSNYHSIFIDLKEYKNHSNKNDIFYDLYEKLLIGKIDKKHVFLVDQKDFNRIESSPFIYWISNDLRNIFVENNLQKNVNSIAVGVQLPTTQKIYFHWELADLSSYKNYLKGGDYNKWYGNKWLVVPNNINLNKSEFSRQSLYGVSSGRQSSKGASFRIKYKDEFVDNGSMNGFVNNEDDMLLLLGFLNCNINLYILDCLNPTVNKQAGDLKRMPFINLNNYDKENIINLSRKNIELKQKLCQFSLIERIYTTNPINNDNIFIKESIKIFLINQFYDSILILINESIINEICLNYYNLNEVDSYKYLLSKGEIINSLQISTNAMKEFVNYFPKLDVHVIDKFKQLDTTDSISITEHLIQRISNVVDFDKELEDICIKFNIHPINLWYWFKEANVLPMNKVKEIALEFVTDHIRTLLAQDDDGIIPLYQQALETRLLDRLVAHLHEQGFTAAQIAEFDNFFGDNLENYIHSGNYYNDLCNRLKLFKRMPSCPFIWHLSSGKYKAFEVYTSIYQWNRDSIFKLKSVYVAKRREQLGLRKSDLRDAESAAAQAEKELIFHQESELDAFEAKLDELIAENYNPILENGVAINIAPLQKKGMLKIDVLNETQLTKYLKAN